MKLIPQSDWNVTPWRSGHGETAEIAIFPADGDLRTGAFDWRVSLAAMGEDAVFSAFPGFDRILTVVEGEGLELDARPDGPCEQVKPLAPVAFPGERSLTGRLTNGAVKNLNLMAARPRASGSVEVLCLRDGGATLSGDANGLLLLSLSPSQVIARDRLGGGHYALDAMSALLQCGTSRFPFDLQVQGTANSRLVVIQVNAP